MSKTIERVRAERGAELLDEKHPGWEWHEGFDDLSRLNIRSGCDCLLGILYENYSFSGSNGYFAGLDVLDISSFYPDSRPTDLGFTGSTDQTKAWREIITERRQNALYGLETGLEGVRTQEGFESAQAATSLV